MPFVIFAYVVMVLESDITAIAVYISGMFYSIDSTEMAWNIDISKINIIPIKTALNFAYIGHSARKYCLL